MCDGFDPAIARQDLSGEAQAAKAVVLLPRRSHRWPRNGRGRSV